MSVEDRAREYLEQRGVRWLGELHADYASNLDLYRLSEFAQLETALTLRRIADELFDFVRTDKRRVMSLEILRERLAVYIEKLRQEAEGGK